MGVGANTYGRKGGTTTTEQGVSGNMGEQEIAVRSVVAGSLWLAGTVLVMLGLFTRYEFGQCGLLCSGAAMMLNVRGFFARFEEREREAFQLGRDYEHGRERLRSLN